MSAFTKFITKKPVTPVQQTGGITDIDTEFMLNSEFDPRIPGFNLADAAGNFKNFLGNLIFTPAGAGADKMPVKPEDDLMQYNEFEDPEYEMPPEEERKNLLERILQFAPFIGEKSLTGILTDALGGARNRLTDFRDTIGKRLGPAPYGTSESVAQSAVASVLDLKIDQIIVVTETGKLARLVSKFKPEVGLFVCTTSDVVVR